LLRLVNAVIVQWLLFHFLGSIEANIMFMASSEESTLKRKTQILLIVQNFYKMQS